MPPATHGPARTAPAPLKRKIVAILAADVAGYSRLVAVDEEGTVRALARARDVFDRRVAEGGGRIFNTAGDSVMCEFDSAVEAVRAAIAIQEDVTALGASVQPERRLAFRIGLTIGDVVEQDGDLLGDGVNMAARLEGLAPVGGLCLSRSMHEAVANKIDRPFTRLGEQRVKNMPVIAEAWTLPAPPAPPAPPPPTVVAAAPAAGGLAADPRHRAGYVPEIARPRARSPLAAIVLLALAGGAGWAGWTYLGRAPERSASVDRNFAASEAPRPAAPSVADKPAGQPQATPARPVTRPAATPRPETAKPDPAPAAETAAKPDGQAKPDTPARPTNLRDGYEAARAAEARGDRAGALAAYAALAPLARDQVDPFVRQAALLRQRGSAEAARRALDEVARSSGSRAAALVAAAQGENAAVVARLEAFAAAQPDYPPAQYLLGDAYLRRPGGASLTERRLAYDSFDRFLEAGDALGRYFVDPGLAAGWLDDARKHRAEIEVAFAGTASRPRVAFSRSEGGWTARIALPEPASRASVRVGEQGAVQSVAVPGGGRSADVAIPPETGRATLYVGYLDASGREAGPFPVPFDPESARVASARDTLERFPESWVSFRPDVPDVLSFAQLAANRCGVASVRIGYGDEAPSRRLPLAACGGAEAGPAVVTLPPGTESVQVQIAYADGSESPVRTFRRP